MEKNVASLLIPPRPDSDSSDDEFLDALDKIENEPDEDEEHIVTEETSDERKSLGSIKSGGGDVEVDGGADNGPSSPASSHSSSNRNSIQSTPRTSHSSAVPSGTELSTNREMPSKFDISLEVETDSRMSTPGTTPFRTPDLTPQHSDMRQNDSFMSCKTTVSATPDTDKSEEDLSKGSSEENTLIVPEPTPRIALSPECDDEVLAMMTIKNLDTGTVTTMDRMTDLLKDADPLSKHLNEKYGYKAEESDSDNSSHYNSRSTIATIEDEDAQAPGHSPTKKKKKLKNLAKKGVKGMKGMSKSVKHISKNMRVTKKENESAAELEVQSGDITVYPNVTYRNHKPDVEEKFKVIELQQMNEVHVGAIWVMKFSMGGKVLASAGDDKNIKIWVIKSSWNHFVEKYRKGKNDEPPVRNEADDGYFESVPFRVFSGSKGPILDLNWSKQYFLLSSGTDKTVRLWHIARQGQLCCFPHPDTVPAVAFHPLNDIYFLSGCLDGRVKLWNIHARKVSSYYRLEQRNNVDSLITAVNFDKRGKLVRAFVGTYDGRVTVLDVTMTNSLDYRTCFDIRGTRNNSARKITSIEQRPNSNSILITSNDSRLRLYDVDNSQLTCKYKGLLNQTSQIKASFSHDGKIIISGDEKNFVYFWETETHYKLFNHTTGKGPLKRQLRRDKNDCYYRFRSHESRVTCGMFAPEALSDNEGFVKEIFVTSDAKGNIKCFLNIRNP